MTRKMRGRGYAHQLGVDPVALLSEGAQYVIESGRCRITLKDAKAIVKMGPKQRERLSDRVELDTGADMSLCIQEASYDVPKATEAKYNGRAREDADQAAAAIDRIYFEPFEFLIDRFCGPHGAMLSEDRREAIECWDEAKKAWKRLRDQSRKYSDTLSKSQG